MAVDYQASKGYKTTMSEERPQQSLRPITSDEVARQLGEIWGRPFTRKDFANLRLNRKAEFDELDIEPVIAAKNVTLWPASVVEKIASNIEPPKLRPELYGKPGRSRSRKQEPLLADGTSDEA